MAPTLPHRRRGRRQRRFGDRRRPRCGRATRPDRRAHGRRPPPPV